MTRNEEIANTILTQLGGKRFVVMTGAKNFVAIDNGLRFTIGKNGSKANRVKITLSWDDTYTMQFIKQSPMPNQYTLLSRFANKGLTEEEFNAQYKVAYNKAVQNAANPVILKEYNGLFFDQLQEFFTEYTKLYTKLW
jgi:hypothetical protein